MNSNFIIVGESILSIYSTENRKFNGNETMIKINKSRYKSYGTLLKGNKKVSSWWVDLIRIED